MSSVLCLRHFETEVQPDVPPEEWGLSESGERAEAEFLESGTVGDAGLVYASHEQKAVDTAEAIAERTGADLRVDERIGEVDRSGEGFLDDERYRRYVERYFRAPETEFDWENRLEVESRLYRFVDEMEIDPAPVVLVSHGMLLTTLLAPALGEDRFEFWEALEFGELLDVEAATIEARWR